MSKCECEQTKKIKKHGRKEGKEASGVCGGHLLCVVCDVIVIDIDVVRCARCMAFYIISYIELNLPFILKMYYFDDEHLV